MFGNPVYTTLRAAQLSLSTRPFTTFQLPKSSSSVFPPEKPTRGEMESYLAFLRTFVDPKEIPKKAWTPREFFYLLEDRGVGNEEAGREKEFGEFVRFAGNKGPSK
jgi:hypothetical protein